MTKQLRTIGLAFVVLLSLSGIASARDRRYPGGSISAREHGNEHGYRDGYQRGRQDRDQSIRYNYTTEDYRMADRGFEPYMGERDDFQDGYRNGYRAGYEDGYNGRSGRWDEVYGIDPNAEPYARGQHESEDDVYVDRHWDYKDVAYDIGYRDGVQEGEKDRKHGKDFRPEKNDRYEDADHGYHKEYGSKDSFKMEYRQAFFRGYEDGYGRWRK
jgi:hypothetical protein